MRRRDDLLRSLSRAPAAWRGAAHVPHIIPRGKRRASRMRRLSTSARLPAPLREVAVAVDRSALLGGAPRALAAAARAQL